ncbi:Electron transport protein SCO1/SenC [Candidatus Zixiibacteriota bacterium]|nr:Electron transport protein SCO1/SenC [candidate division Zixibacteria bacterium]
MNSGTKFLKILVWTAAAFFVLAVAALLVLNKASQSRAEIPVLGQLPAFTFTAQDGQPFGRDNMMGKINVVDFIFTHCKGPCPVMASKMSNLYKLYAGSDKVQFISISVDPENDSLSILREYAARQGVTDNRWVFLRAPLDSVVQLSEKGFMIAADDLPAGHSTKFILVDGQGQIRGYYDGLDDASLEIMKTHIRELAQHMK